MTRSLEVTVTGRFRQGKFIIRVDMIFKFVTRRLARPGPRSRVRGIVAFIFGLMSSFKDFNTFEIP
jgi:hypothetical protein